MFLPPEEMSLPRRLAQSYIPYYRNKGWSGAATLRELRRAGVGYREGDFYRDWGEWGRALEKTSGIRFTTWRARPTEEMYNPQTWISKYRYATKVRVDYFDPVTKRMHKQYVTVGHQHLEAGRWVNDLTQEKTAGEIKEEAERLFIEGTGPSNVEIRNVVLEQGWKYEGAWE